MTRPAHVLVLGTGTEVGKTWVAAAVARELRDRGVRVAARKPAQSFEPGDPERHATDAQVLAAATGEDPATVCPPARWYPRPLAPPMAAAALGRPAFTVADLAAELAVPAPAVDLVLVEGAGGVRSPVADDGDALDLGLRLGVDAVVLVADAGLGTINAVRLSVAAIAAAGLPAPVVVLNRFDPGDALHAGNRDWLGGRDGLACVIDAAGLVDALGAAGSRGLQ